MAMASDGERYSFIRLEREERKENLVGTNEREGATVASQTRRRDEEGEMGLFAWSSTRPDVGRFICNW